MRTSANYPLRIDSPHDAAIFREIVSKTDMAILVKDTFLINFPCSIR